MQARLSVVGGEMPDPPYPGDTKVRGWRLELDYERIQQSDTWALTTPDMRPWLLMVYFTAWQQIPAASLPNDDELIAARIGMDRRLFAAHRDLLLRGWRLHSDARLYHPVLVACVQRYLSQREQTAARVARHRKRRRLEAGVARNALLTGDSRVSNALVTTPEPEPVPVPGTQQRTNTEINSAPARSKRQAARADAPPEEIVWQCGMQLLLSEARDPPSARDEGVARQFLGRLAKRYGQTVLAQAIVAAQQNCPIDLKPYVVAVCKRLEEERDATDQRGSRRRPAEERAAQFNRDMQDVIAWANGDGDGGDRGPPGGGDGV